MLTLTCPVETPLHRLPAGGKAGGAGGLHGRAVPADPRLPGWRWRWPCGGAAPALGRGGSRPCRPRMLRPLWPFVLVVALWHLWVADPRGGAVVVLRMAAAVAAANLVTMTTRLSATCWRCSSGWRRRWPG